VTAPQFLVIGHVCRDLHEGGHRLGGTAAYASFTAQRLGFRAAALTSSAETDLAYLLPGVDICNLPSSVTTTFQNMYSRGTRQQRLHAVASEIQPPDMPPDWLHTPVVLLGPIVHEIAPSFATAFQGSLVGINPQGWMRQWDARGRVSPVIWDGDALEGLAQVVVLGESDLKPGQRLEGWLEWVPVLLVTQSEQGALMRYGGDWYRVPAYSAQEVDPTGAGDVFAAAFLVRYHETGDPYASALFASCAAAVSVEGLGLEAIPSRRQVKARMEKHSGMEVVRLQPGELLEVL